MRQTWTEQQQVEKQEIEEAESGTKERELTEETISSEGSADSEAPLDEKEAEARQKSEDEKKAENTGVSVKAEVPAPKPITRRTGDSGSAFNTPLRGSLGDMDLAHVIREIYVNRRTGILHLTRRGVGKRIYFKKGSIVFANSDLKDDRLADLLARKKVVHRSALDEALNVVKETGCRLGVALVELGHLDEKEMTDQVTEQIKSIIFSVFDWIEGQFAFERLETPVEKDIIVGLLTADTILEGIRRMKSTETVRQSLGALDRVLAHPDNPLLMYQKFSLTPEEGFVMSRGDGTTTVAEAAALSPMSEEETLRCIYGLVCAGVLTLEERAQSRTDVLRRLITPDEAKLPLQEAEIKEQPVETKPASYVEQQDSGPTPEQQQLRDEIAAKHASLASATHYELLEVEPAAVGARIKEAYYAMVKKYHPDRHHSPHFEDLHGLLEELIVKVTAAYNILSTPADRAQYDETLQADDESKPSTRQSTFIGEPDFTTAPPEEQANIHYQEAKRLFYEMAYFDAIQRLQEAVRLDPTKATYHKLLADSLSKNPNWRKDAESHFLKALDLDASYVDCYLGLASIYDDLGLTTRSRNTYLKVLELEPDNELAQMKVQGKKKSRNLMDLLRKKT